MKILKELFYVPKYGKVKEKTFFAQLAASITVIVLCMAAMSFSAYAYFSCSVTSGVNTITAANFDLDISIDGNIVNDRSISLAAGKSYKISLTYPAGNENIASTGYCIIEAGSITIRTAQIGADESTESGRRESISFTLIVGGSGTAEIKFIPQWGTSAQYAVLGIGEDATDTYYISGDETIEIKVSNGTAPETEQTESTTPTEAKPEETEPIETQPETQPETTAPAETEPAETTPDEIQPEETESTQPEPTETQQPEETQPVQTDPGEAEPQTTESVDETTHEDTAEETTEEPTAETGEETQ